MHPRRALTALTLQMLACAPPSIAQVPLASDSTQAAIAQLRPGSWLRLNLKGAGRVEGRYVGATAFGVTTERPTRSIVFSEIDSVWVRGRSTAKGAGIGALIGGVLTAIVLASIEGSSCAGDACNVTGYVALGAVTGAAGGTLVGAGLDRYYPSGGYASPKGTPAPGDAAA